MQIDLKRLNDACHFEATNEQGLSILLDGSPEVGGENMGMRPMQVLIAALGGCSSIDVVSILKKQRQDLQDIQITLRAERQKNAVPALFEEINVHFKLLGTLDKDKVGKAIALSMEKYCSVAKILEPTATITYSYEIISG